MTSQTISRQSVKTPQRSAPTAITAAQVETLENALTECGKAFQQSSGALSRSLVIARGLQQLDALIEPAMPSIMALMNTPLGFLTDRDPTTFKDGKPVTPYEPAIVKRCVIEAALRGARWVGNEFNIISRRPYLTKEYFARKVAEIEGLSDLQLRPGVPATSQNGALVPFVATWKLNGKPMRLERVVSKLDDGSPFDNRIPVRVNASMGVDAILGKAERKILAGIYRLLTATELDLQDDDEPAGPVIEGTVVESQVVQQAPADEAAGERAEAESAHEAAEGSQEAPSDDGQQASGGTHQNLLSAHFEHSADSDGKTADRLAKEAGGRPLSELCLAIEYSLHDPDLTAARNEELRIDIDNARAEGQLTQREVDHLLAIVARNADVLTQS